MTGESIRHVVLSAGFDLVGFAPADPAPDCERDFTEWLGNGYHGEMKYLENHVIAKYRPSELLDGARTVIMVAFNYFQESAGQPGFDVSPNEAYGNVSVYAWGRDYHKVLGGRLRKAQRELERMFPDDAFRRFTDVLPISERHYAEAAGLGFTGRNTLLITPRFGSWVFLGGILTTLAIETPESADEYKVHTCPPGCSRCTDACPTGALFAPYRINASKCISYRTIERKGGAAAVKKSGESRTLDTQTGSWLFGCDVCQRVCPFNAGAQQTTELDFINWIAGPAVSLEEVECIQTRDEYLRRFAGGPLMRAGVDGLKRNATIVRRNNGKSRDEPVEESS